MVSARQAALMWRGPTRPAGKEVIAVNRESVVHRPEPSVWEAPTAEEIRVSAEATAYMGTWKDQDWL